MNSTAIGKSALLASIVLGMIFLLVSLVLPLFDNRTKIIFCNVGQGDGSYIRIKNKVDVLIDAGPDKRILDCLGKYMPFYDKKIELIFLTHPQKDHMNGVNYLFDRFQIGTVFLNKLQGNGMFFKLFKTKLKNSRTKVHFPIQGEKITILSDYFSFIWPPLSYINDFSLQNNDQDWPTPLHDPNDYSLVFSFQEGLITLLYTGDISPQSLDAIEDNHFYQSKRPISLLKIPHHGSKNGLTLRFLELANPTLGVISVGRNNSYGHPAKELLGLLASHKVPYLRTDQEGDIVFYIENGRLIRDKR